MGDTYRDLEEYIALTSAGRAAFEAAHPYPFLTRLPQTLPSTPNPWDDEFSFNTHVPGVETPVDEDEDRPSHAVIVQAVRKRPDGAFPMRIGIGRTRNSDVMLRFASVSKLHAQIHIDTTPWQLVDLDSANGTYVNGVCLRPRQLHPIAIGDTLRIGTVDVTLVSAGTLYDRLRELRP